MAPAKRNFADLLADPDPALKVSFSPGSDEEPLIIPVKTTAGDKMQEADGRYLRSVCADDRLSSMLAFYEIYDGADLCAPYMTTSCSSTPVLKLLPSSEIESVTRKYARDGELAGAIDFNKSKTLYRGSDAWMVFALVEDGTSCLSIFLDGEHAGRVFLITPQPWFNILKPIAGSFGLFLDRLVKDPAAFFKLIRSYIVIQKPDGQNYGFLPVGYIPDLKITGKDNIFIH